MVSRAAAVGCLLCLPLARAVRLLEPQPRDDLLEMDPAEMAKKIRAKLEGFLESKGITEAAAKAQDMSLSGNAILDMGNSQAEEASDLSLGVGLSRSAAFVEEGSMLDLELDHGCQDEDKMGANNCTFHARERVHVRLRYKLKEPAGEGAFFSLNFTSRLVGWSAIIGQELLGKKVKGFQTTLPWREVTCPLCGEKCELAIFGKKQSFATPPCPIPAGVQQTVVDQDFAVPSNNGLKVMQSRHKFKLALKRADGSDIASAEGKAKIGKLFEANCPPFVAEMNLCDHF